VLINILFEKMIPGEIHILPTDNTPEVLLNPDGIIKIKGRALTVNTTEVPEQILNWIDAYLSNPPETTDVIIAFEYLNSFSTTILVSVLMKISQVIQHNKKFVIHWYYEEEDDDILERGEHISETYNIPIEFIMINNIADL
jgi:hypothetical protein